MSSKDSESSGRLVVISGPSGVGKTVVCDCLIASGRCTRLITATSRAPREGEVDGVHYHFYKEQQFRQEVANGEFLEHAEVYGNLYGTPRAALEQQLNRGETVLANIDVQGAETLLDRGVEGVFIFLEPPSWDELERRLRARSTDGPEAIRIRLENAKQEMAVRHRYDHQVVNDELDETVTKINALLFAATDRVADAGERGNEVGKD